MTKAWLSAAILAAAAATAGCSGTSIWQASADGDQDRVRWLLGHHPELIDRPDDRQQWTPLQHAIAASDGAMVALLLDRGAAPGATAGDGRTARGFAVDVENDRMRQFILERLDQVACQGSSPWPRAAAASVPAQP